MITLEEAYKYAKDWKPNTNLCCDLENVFIFSSTEDEGTYGGIGHTSCVIVKADGRQINMADLVFRVKRGRKLHEYEITEDGTFVEVPFDPDDE